MSKVALAEGSACCQRFVPPFCLCHGSERGAGSAASLPRNERPLSLRVTALDSLSDRLPVLFFILFIFILKAPPHGVVCSLATVAALSGI